MKRIARKHFVVIGIVQGVGFRPFIYNIAIENNLKGRVKNTSEGVFIDIEGEEKNINRFFEKLRYEAPPLSKIDEIIIENRDIKKFKRFSIEKSHDNNNTTTLISPDFATCQECANEVKDKNDRRYKYPFANCTNCGPRFSIIKKLPYDRPMTTMKKFKLCTKCKTEYEHPLDRRFHAQPNACPECGPRVWLTDSNGNGISTGDPINMVKELLKDGKILAIKGLGGFHLVCNGKDEKAISILRERKSRQSKPFALMMKDIDEVKKYCYVNKKEESILTGIRKPILLLQKKGELLPENIAPNYKNLGVMLPYTPLHHLLFGNELKVLIMTSANISGLPIVYKNEEALEKLKDMVDFYLLHDRDINLPVDDSVSVVVKDKERLIRRSRGYAPLPVIIDDTQETIAYGSQMKNTFCISKGKYAFLSQHMGDIDSLEAYKSYEFTANHFKELYNIQSKIVAYDMHPDFLLSKFAKEENCKKVAVQHHHAHIVSCMAENKISKRIIGLAFDGTGLGTDNNIWGGEFILCDYKDFQRVGHLNYVKMPGLQAAVREPWRMGISYLFKAMGSDIDTCLIRDLPEKSIKTIISMIKKNINSIETSSMGRLFDAVSAIIGLKNKNSYEGEAAINLEAISHIKEDGKYKYVIDTKETFIINTDSMIKEIVMDINNNIEVNIIAKRFHNTVIDFSIEMCILIRDKYEINSVGLSGGVFQNRIIFEGIYNRLIECGFEVYTHSEIPCNDGGIALGQLVIANNKLNTGG